MRYKRVFLIVIDSLGVGEMPDASEYGDEGANTLAHLSEKRKIYIPHLEALGLGNLTKVNGAKEVIPLANVTKMLELSVGKDTLTGHHEMMGLYTTEPLKTFTDNGFPIDLIDEIEKQTGYKVIGNKAASGTVIIEELGKRHLETKELIVYTSSDSVLQIAACEDVVPLPELYRICEIVREITKAPKWRVGRVIARPFIVTDKGFVRTPNRHDYALKPKNRTVLDEMKDQGFDVISIGKIRDIFAGQGITQFYLSASSIIGMKQTIEQIEKPFTGLCFTNLVDFDSSYGHRRDPLGYGRLLEEFDVELGNLLKVLKNDDLLILTADHGNDPTFKGTDHTREMVPLIVYNKNLKGSIMPIRKSFADIGASLCENFEIEKPKIGESFINILR